MPFRFLQDTLVGKVYIYINDGSWKPVFEGYVSNIPEELIDYKVIEVSSGYDWRNNYDETESYIEITLEEK